jgi:acyl carrier protein
VFIPDETFSEDNMPIGKPLKRYTAMIVDENNNNLAVGETGQLLVGGPALARGYLNRPELNAEVFVTVKTANGIERMYKTGDLARWRENGDIEFAGRIDHQIKLGSYRIEPGEIEVAINEYPEVLESLVSYDEIESKKALVAYVAQGKNNIKLEQLNEYLKQNLPAYMVPARFVLLKNFPKTTNGKIDRKALPDPSSSEVARASGFVAPRNQLEKNLTNMWQEVLRIPQVGIHDDFFALGGSSLLAVGIVSRLISEMDLELPVRDFFANPTVASQAAHIQRLLNDDSLSAGIDTDIETTNSDSQTLRDRLPKITPSFFKSSNDKKLYGIHYQPPVISNVVPRSHAVLMCHPLGHEYPRSYRNLQQLAIQLSQAGFDVFRFDYYATGNSEGNSEDITAEQCALDIEVASDYLRQKSSCKKLSLLTVRLAAPFALKANLKNIENMIAWDPVMKGADHLDMLERFHDKELKAYNFFSQIRHRSEIDQLFGHAYSPEKRTSLGALNMPIATTLAKNNYFISSANFLESEKNASLLSNNWQHLPNDDEIYWHDQDYAFSAFSSPQTFKAVLQILDNREINRDENKEKWL